MTKGNKVVESSTSKKLSAKDFAEVERILGFPLPKDLKKHYEKHNGGKLEKRFFHTADRAEHSIQTFLPMRHARFDGQVVLEGSYDRLVRKKKLIRTGLIPFAINEGGDYYCMDAKDQSVKFCPMDRGPKTPAETPVATSLKAFIDAMVTEAEFYG